MREAERKYSESTGEKMAHWQRAHDRALHRNLAHVTGDLVRACTSRGGRALGGDATMAGKYGRWRTASGPAGGHRLDTVRLTPARSGSIPSGAHRRRLSPPQAAPQAHRPQGPQARVGSGEWARQTTGEAICSYPPEDLVIEEYGRFLKQKAKAILSEERVRVEPSRLPFWTAWISARPFALAPEEKSSCARPTGWRRVGAVVVISTDDPEDHYQYLTTWRASIRTNPTWRFTRLFRSITWWVGYRTRRIRRTIGYASSRGVSSTSGRIPITIRGVQAGAAADGPLDYSMDGLSCMWPPNRRALFSVPSRSFGPQDLYVPIGQLSPTR